MIKDPSYVCKNMENPYFTGFLGLNNKIYFSTDEFFVFTTTNIDTFS